MLPSTDADLPADNNDGALQVLVAGRLDGNMQNYTGSTDFLGSPRHQPSSHHANHLSQQTQHGRGGGGHHQVQGDVGGSWSRSEWWLRPLSAETLSVTDLASHVARRRRITRARLPLTARIRYTTVRYKPDAARGPTAASHRLDAQSRGVTVSAAYNRPVACRPRPSTHDIKHDSRLSLAFK